MFGLLIPIAVIALVVFGVRRARREGSPLPAGQQVRLFFLYLTLLAVLLVATAGLAGSLGPLVDDARLIADDSNDSALNLAMLLLGAPLTAWLAMSTRKRIAADRTELQSYGWTLFATVGTVAPLVVAMFGAYRTLLGLVRAENYDGFAVTQTVVWGVAWYVVRRIDRTLVRAPRTSLRDVVPVLIGLGVSAVAVGQLVSGLVQRMFDIGAEAVFVPTNTQLHRGIALLVIGAAVWSVEWLRGLSRDVDSEAWRFVVVLFGVTGGLVTAISAVAVAAYQVVVWLVGSPQSDVARVHFESHPGVLGGAIAGIMTWWYHRSLLAQRRSDQRAEVDRAYEHIMAAGGLVAGSFGVAILLVAAIEAVTGTRLVRGDDAVNTLLLACTLLVIGIPVWATYWRITMRHESANERGSMTRRIYLVTVLGVGGLTALGTAIAAVYLLLRDALEGRVDSSTLRSARYALATVLTSGVVAGYHVSVFRSEHTAHYFSTPPLPPAIHGNHRRIVIAGPSDAALESALLAIPGTEVEWMLGSRGDWPIDDTVARVQRSEGDIVLILTPSGVKIGRS